MLRWSGCLLVFKQAQDIKCDVGSKQHPSMTNPLCLCFWHKACNSLAGHREEFAMDNKAGQSIRSSLGKVSASSLVGEEDLLRVICLARQPNTHLCCVP